MSTVSESRYKSFIKPVKFWQKSSTQQSDIDEVVKKDEEEQNKYLKEETPKKNYYPTFNFKKKQKENTVVALEESCKTEVYKLSLIDGTGLYMPPSPTLEGKRDHWVEINEEDIMDFQLPSSECLTTFNGEKHDFFTPSCFVQSQPYILPIMSDSTLSTVPSLDDSSESSSCRSSTIIN